MPNPNEIQRDEIESGYVCQSCGVLIDGTRPGWPRICGRCREFGKAVETVFDEHKETLERLK